jgi:hypothetical protein
MSISPGKDLANQECPDFRPLEDFAARAVANPFQYDAVLVNKLAIKHIMIS